jgi:hypothetical protein
LAAGGAALGAFGSRPYSSAFAQQPPETFNREAGGAFARRAGLFLVAGEIEGTDLLGSGVRLVAPSV